MFEDFVGGFLGEMSVACAHTLTGLVITGGLTYLAIQGKRGTGWNKLSKEMEEVDVCYLEEMSVTGGIDLLVRENKGSRKAENTDWDVEREGARRTAEKV